MRRVGILVLALLLSLSLVSQVAPPGAYAAPGWTLSEAAKPYKGVTINAAFLDRPGYYAAEKLIPEFMRETGITVKWETIPYENTHEKEVLDFTSRKGTYDVVLIDLVWIGEFADAGWVVPLDRFLNDPKLADPKLNLKGFFPVLLTGFGTWDNKVYGLPFDNYGGLMFYNKAMLRAAGFSRPPRTWDELRDVYGPKLTHGGVYAYALQSRRGETQSADAFARFQWGLGNGLFDEKTCKPLFDQPAALKALEYQISLKKIMPPDIGEWDHDETVQALAQGKVAMINEWSAFYAYLNDAKTSKIVSDLGVGVEPLWSQTNRRVPAFGGFSIGVNAFSPRERQNAAWLFIQWITSEAQARNYVLAGGVSARMSVYKDEALAAKYPYFGPLVETWKVANYKFRPRFAEWPQISDVIAQYASAAFVGQMSPQDALRNIQQETYKILDKAGYYSGKKKCLQ